MSTFLKIPPPSLLMVLSLTWLATAHAQMQDGDTPYSSLLAKLDSILAGQAAAEQRSTSLAARLDNITDQLTGIRAAQSSAGEGLQALASRLDNLTAQLSTREQQPAPKPLCLDGWQQIGSYCYTATNETRDKISWEEAETACSTLSPSGHLASIHNESLAGINLLLADSGTDFVWLGLRQDGGVWKWNDGSPLDFTNWGDRQPDEALEFPLDCVYSWLPELSKWSAWHCSERFNYLCQAELAA